jgi:hypothetical protein
MFCNPKQLVLKKAINKHKFEDNNELIKVNLAWTQANIMVKLLPVGGAKKVTGEKESEESQILQAVNKERGAVIDGAIVKIMKTNKDTAVKH